MTARIRDFLRRRADDGPCLVVDLDLVRENYLAFAKALPDTKVFYAVKANPAPEVLSLLAALGSCFDTASVAEIEMVLAAGVAGGSHLLSATPSRRNATSRAPTRSACDCSRSIAWRRWRRSRARRPAPGCSAASCPTAWARNGRCRASSAASRRWRRRARARPAPRARSLWGLLPCRVPAAQSARLGSRARLGCGGVSRMRGAWALA